MAGRPDPKKTQTSGSRSSRKKTEATAETPPAETTTVAIPELRDALLARIRETIRDSEVVASGKNDPPLEHRVRHGGKTLAYVTPQKKAVRVTVTALEGKPKVSVASEAEIPAAVDRIKTAVS